MGVSWNDVEMALKQTRARSIADNRWYTIINEGGSDTCPYGSERLS